MSNGLRPVLADLLDGLASALPYSFASGGNARQTRFYRGAETLRWCADFEAGAPEDLQAEIDSLTADLDARVDAVRETINDWQHTDACPAGAATADAPCHCDLKMRQDAVLFAVDAYAAKRAVFARLRALQADPSGLLADWRGSYRDPGKFGEGQMIYGGGAL